MTRQDLIVQAESVADRAIRANTSWLEWEAVKHKIHPITDAMVRDALARVAPQVLPDLQELLKASALFHPDLVTKLETVAAVLREATAAGAMTPAPEPPAQGEPPRAGGKSVSVQCPKCGASFFTYVL